MFDADRVNRDANVAVEFTFAGGGVEGPRMPGAGDYATFEPSLTEWAAMMRAGSVDGADFAVDVAEGVGSITVEDFDDRAFGEFFEAGEFFERQISV